MIAIIKINRKKLQVKVKSKLIDGTGYVRIVDEYGVVYETHLSNVCIIDGGQV